MFNKNNIYGTEVTSPFWAFEPVKLDLTTAKQCDKIPTERNYQAFHINPTLHTVHSVTYIQQEDVTLPCFWSVAAISILIIFIEKDITALIKHFNT